MLQLVLSLNKDIDPLFVNALYNGIAYSDSLKDVDVSLLEQLFAILPCTSSSSSAQSFCRIIKEKRQTSWSQIWLDTLKTLALRCEEPTAETAPESQHEEESARDLENVILNTVRGMAIQAIGHLLRDDSELYGEFKDVIAELCTDEDLSIRYACLYALWPAYNIDREWAREQIFRLYKNDYRLLVFPDSRRMLLHLYLFHPNDVRKMICKCYSAADKQLIQTGAHTLAEMYLQKDEFADIITHPAKMSKEQASAIIEMIAHYFNKPEYNEKAKDILENFFECKFEIDMPWERLFYDKKIHMDRDREFVLNYK